jgi:hypothetical protein
MICGLLTALAANILCLEFNPGGAERIVYSIVFIAANSYILGITSCYILYGVKKKPGLDRAAVTWLMLLLFAALLFINGGIVILQALSGAYSLLIMFFVFMIMAKKTTGDNKIYDSKDSCLDPAFFTYVDEALYKTPVLFPLDIENYRRDRGKGRVKKIGIVREGKYLGRCGALAESGKNAYLCPLSQIVPQDRITGADGVIASCFNEVLVKAVFWNGGGDTYRIMVIGSEGKPL